MPVIDFQHHYVPRALAERYGYAPGKTAYATREGIRSAMLHDRIVDLDQQIRDMDAGNIDIAVLSCVVGWDASAEDCRLINDDFAKVQQGYGGRFVGLAHSPVGQDNQAAAAEIERAVRDLGLRGVTVGSQVYGKPLDSPDLAPFYRKAQELDVVIFVHPSSSPAGYALTRDHDLNRILGRELDLMVATTRLIMGGVLDEFPDLRFVMGHFGGGIAAVKDRLVAKGYRFGTLKRPFQDYFSQLAFDTAGFEGAEGALRAALSGIRASQLVFATDYPQDFTGQGTDTGKGPADMARYSALIRSLPLDEHEKDWILSEHASKLLHLDHQHVHSHPSGAPR